MENWRGWGGAGLFLALAGCVGEIGSGGRPLELIAADPASLSARGGSLVLTGHGFEPGAAVTLGGSLASEVEVPSSERAEVRFAPIFAGAHSLELINPDGRRAALARPIEVLPLALAFSELEPPTLPGKVVSALLIDADADGDLDAVAAGEMGGWLALNDGSGNFGEPAPLDLPPGTRVLLAADFDGDGKLDLFAGSGDPAVPDRLLLGDGDGGFDPTDVPAFDEALAATSAAIAADLDGDGDLDLVVGSDGDEGPPLRIFLAEGGLLVRAPADSEPGGEWRVAALSIADVDGDGDADLVLATPEAADGAGVRLLRNEGSGGEIALSPATLPPVAEVVRAIAPGDVDGDGDVDLLLIAKGQDRLLRNDGGGSFFDDTMAAIPFDLSDGRAGSIADVDRDGRADVLIATAGGQSRLYLGDGERLVDRTPLLPQHDDDSRAIHAGDIDGDGDLDVVLFNASSPSRVYLSVEKNID